MFDLDRLLSALATMPDDDAAHRDAALRLKKAGDPRHVWLAEPDLRPFARPGLADPLPRLLAALADDALARRAVRGLALIGERAASPLRELAESADPAVAARALVALSHADPADDVTSLILSHRHSPHAVVRDTVAKILDEFGLPTLTARRRAPANPEPPPAPAAPVVCPPPPDITLDALREIIQDTPVPTAELLLVADALVSPDADLRREARRVIADRRFALPSQVWVRIADVIVAHPADRLDLAAFLGLTDATDNQPLAAVWGMWWLADRRHRGLLVAAMLRLDPTDGRTRSRLRSVIVEGEGNLADLPPEETAVALRADDALRGRLLDRVRLRVPGEREVTRAIILALRPDGPGSAWLYREWLAGTPADRVAACAAPAASPELAAQLVPELAAALFTATPSEIPSLLAALTAAGEPGILAAVEHVRDRPDATAVAEHLSRVRPMPAAACPALCRAAGRSSGDVKRHILLAMSHIDPPVNAASAEIIRGVAGGENDPVLLAYLARLDDVPAGTMSRPESLLDHDEPALRVLGLKHVYRREPTTANLLRGLRDFYAEVRAAAAMLAGENATGEVVEAIRRMRNDRRRVAREAAEAYFRRTPTDAAKGTT